MADNKKSFVLYTDLIHTVEKLSSEDAGDLLKHILRYVNDKNPEPPTHMIDLVFEPIKQSLKRDLKRYEARAERSKANGAKGGRPKKNPEEPKKPSGLIDNPTEPRKPDSVIVSDSDSVNVIVKKTIEERAEIFKKKILSHSKAFHMPFESIKEFFSYWTESNEGAKKMRFELAKNQPFAITRRLATWKKNQKPMTGQKLQQSRTEINNESIDKMLEQQKRNHKL
jgi:hypothetical protein